MDTAVIDEPVTLAPAGRPCACARPGISAARCACHPERPRERSLRSLAKAVSYRFVGSTLTAAAALVATGRVDLAAGIGAADAVLKIGAFYAHERLWLHIPWGRCAAGRRL